MKNYYLSAILVDELKGTIREQLQDVYVIPALTFDEAERVANDNLTKAPRSYWKWSLNKPKGYEARTVTK